MNEYVFFLDLINEPDMIAQYDRWHQRVWPEVESQILKSGVTSCRIYRYSNRLVLIVNSNNEINWEAKAISDKLHQPTLSWEEEMWKFQQAIPGANEDEKWMLASKIYHLEI